MPFPKDFLWGTSISAAQAEGAWDEGGKSPVQIDYATAGSAGQGRRIWYRNADGTRGEIHGSMVVFSVLMAPLMSAYTANAAVVTAAGGDPSVLTYADNFTPLFACMSAMACCGGTGDTFGLVLDSLLFGKSEQAKAVGKAALVPGIFNINEPATFGYPIMYNPTLGLPYVLTPIIIYLLELLCYRLGWLQIPFVLSFSLVPIGVAEFITTLSWKNVLFSFLMIPVSMLIFLPFFKVYDNQKLKEEKEAKAAEEAAATK